MLASGFRAIGLQAVRPQFSDFRVWVPVERL